MKRLKRLTAWLAAGAAAMLLAASPVHAKPVSAAADSFAAVLHEQPECRDGSADFSAGFTRAVFDYGDRAGRDLTAQTGSTAMTLTVIGALLLSLLWCCTGHKSYPVYAALLLLCGLNAVSIAELICKMTGQNTAAFSWIPLRIKLLLAGISLVLAVFGFLWRRMSAFLMLFASALPLTSLGGWLILRTQIINAYAQANGLRTTADAAAAESAMQLSIGMLAAFALGAALLIAIPGTRFKKPFLMTVTPLSFGLRGGYLLTALILGTGKPSGLTWLAAALLALGGFLFQIYLGHGFAEHIPDEMPEDAAELFPDGEMPQDTYIDGDFYGTEPEPPQPVSPVPAMPAPAPVPVRSPAPVPANPPAPQPGSAEAPPFPDPFAAAAAQQQAAASPPESGMTHV